MFKIDVNIGANIEPWNLSLELRCSILRTELLKGKKITILLYEFPDTSTFRYRGYNIFKASQKSEEWSSIYFFLHEINEISSFLPLILLLVVIRVRWTHEVDEIIYKAKGAGVKVIFDVDDLIFDLNQLNVVTNTLNVDFASERDYEFWFGMISRIGFSASKADGFITTNSFLGDRLKEKYQKPYMIIPNSLNQEQLDASSKILSIKKRKKSINPFCIGYFSGTPSHINDFKVVSEELIELMNEFSGISLKIVGFMEFPESMTKLLKQNRVSFTPLVNFLELQRLIAEVDINIVPLVNNAFSNCKSELKYFEASIVETITLATPTYTYNNCINDGINGFLCKPGKWYERIKQIYSGKIDTVDIAQNAHMDAINNYSGSKIVQMIDESYNFFHKEL